MQHVFLTVKSRIREVSGSGMEVSRSIRNDDIRPVLKRILRNRSAESEGGEDLNHSCRFNVQGVGIKTVLRIYQIATRCGIFVHAYAAAIELDENLVFGPFAEKAGSLSAGCRRSVGRGNSIPLSRFGFSGQFRDGEIGRIVLGRCNSLSQQGAGQKSDDGFEIHMLDVISFAFCHWQRYYIRVWSALQYVPFSLHFVQITGNG